MGFVLFFLLFILLWFVCFVVLAGFVFWGVSFLSFVILTQDLSVNVKSYMDTLKSFPFTELTDGEKNPSAQEI